MTENKYNSTIQLSHLLASDIGINGDEATIVDAVYCSKVDITDSNLRMEIIGLFHVEIEQDRISNTVKRLIEDKKLYRIGNKLVLTPNTLDDISHVVLYNERVELSALDAWIEQYRQTLTFDLTSEVIELIKQCIVNFVKTFFLTHGADCYNLITGEKQNSRFDIESIAVDSVKLFIPEHIDTLKPFLCQIFTLDMSCEQMSFLLQQLKKAIHYLSMVVDGQTKSAIMHQLDGLSLYLDTTILYRLFNLQGEKRYLPIKNLICFCRSAKISLKVFQTTLNEMKRRIDYDARVITNHPTPVSYASIGYKCRSSENYISTFWKEQSENGVSAKDFNFRHSNILTLLQEQNIVVDDFDYISEFNLKQKMIDFRGKIVNYDNTDPEYQKSSNAIDHDAECLTNVEQLQIKNVSSAIESKTLFLSTDWCLYRLQRYDYEYKSKTDLVVLPSQLMQIFCMTAATIDYYEAFLGLFSSSRSSFGTSKLENSQIQEIMGRVALYKGTTPAFTERILANQLIQSSFSTQKTEEDKNDLIEDAMFSEVEKMEEILEVNEKTIKQAQADNIDKVDRIDNLGRRIVALEGTFNQTNEKLAEAEKTISKYEHQFAKQAAKKGKLKAFLRYLGGWTLIGIGGIVILICIIAIIPFTSHIVAPIFSWLNSSAIIVGEKNSSLGIITVSIPLGIAAITAGCWCVKLVFPKLVNDYTEKYLKILSRRLM